MAQSIDFHSLSELVPAPRDDRLHEDDPPACRKRWLLASQCFSVHVRVSSGDDSGGADRGRLQCGETQAAALQLGLTQRIRT